MTPPSPDQSRDRRIEDLTNLWIVHPAARRLLPWFVARGVSANAVSLGGLALGTLAAVAYSRWDSWPLALAGLALSMGWLIADGLDGMIARATNTASAVGRALDGLCDHGVFVLIYVVLAWSVGTPDAWVLAAVAGAAHAVQSNLYESERTRFHGRRNGVVPDSPAPSRNPLVQLYDYVAGTLDRFGAPLDEALQRHRDPRPFAQAYCAQAARPLRLMSLLSANVRVCAIFLACLAGNPRLFWWFEIVPLTAILVIGLLWHRAVEAGLIQSLSQSDPSLSQRT